MKREFEAYVVMLGKNLLALRKERGWSQQATAYEAGLDLRQYQHLEKATARSNPTLKTLSQLANLFEVEVAELLKQEERPRK